MIAQAKQQIRDQWGEEVIAECAKHEPLNMDAKTFIEHCFAMGGDWGAMLLTGIKELRPSVWEIIPNNMGVYAWECICSTLILCGIDTSE